LQIESINEQKKTISIKIPLTTTSGKIRIKKRSSILEYGMPYATRQNTFKLDNYVEWQIGYDVHNTSSNFDKTRLKDITFVAYNQKTKSLYELSEYLHYFYIWGVISKQDLMDVKNMIIGIDDNNLLSEHKHCKIKRTHPNEKEINGIKFNALTIEYPQLIHQFEQFEIITEITIREKL
jgi:hypothetical protein